MERKQYLIEQIKAGKDRESVRRELISAGESTSGLEEDYKQAVAELGVPEPKPAVPGYIAFSANPEVHQSTHMVLPSLGSLFSGSFSFALSKFKEVLLVSVLFTLPSLFVFVPAHFISLPIVSIFLMLSLFLFVVGAGAVMAVGVEGSNFSDALQWSISKFLSIFWLLLCGVLTAIGACIFFVIPMFFVLVHILFAPVSYIREDARGMRALIRSHDIAEGNLLKMAPHILAMLVLILAFVGIGSVLLLMAIPIISTFLFSITFVFVAILTLNMRVRLYEAAVVEKTLFDLSSYGRITWLYRLFFLVGLLILCVSGYLHFKNVETTGNVFESLPMMDQIDTSWDFLGEGEDIGSRVSETLIISKVETTAASAKLYRGRMGFYDGVCDDITVVAPIVCKNTSEYFLIYSALTPTSYYCADSNNFSGEVEHLKDDRCQ